jgi:hypothetical protein
MIIYSLSPLCFTFAKSTRLGGITPWIPLDYPITYPLTSSSLSVPIPETISFCLSPSAQICIVLSPRYSYYPLNYPVTAPLIMPYYAFK